MDSTIIFVLSGIKSIWIFLITQEICSISVKIFTKTTALKVLEIAGTRRQYSTPSKRCQYLLMFISSVLKVDILKLNFL